VQLFIDFLPFQFFLCLAPAKNNKIIKKIKKTEISKQPKVFKFFF